VGWSLAWSSNIHRGAVRARRSGGGQDVGQPPTVRRVIKQMNSTRKKGRSATERDEFLRAAWRVMVAAVLDPGRLVFVDEYGTHTSLAPVWLLCQRGASECVRSTEPGQEHDVAGGH
jgi:hypothetical protein